MPLRKRIRRTEGTEGGCAISLQCNDCTDRAFAAEIKVRSSRLKDVRQFRSVLRPRGLQCAVA